MGAIGEPNDQIRISATSDPDDHDLLAIERMVRMGNGDGFRKCLGWWGSVLWGFRPGQTSWCKK
jgi:hypothetical protein